MVVVGRDDRYGFRHALLREVIYDDLLPGERAELHLWLARALEDAAADSDDPVPIRAAAVAHHFNAAGDQPEALRSAVAAARAVEGRRAPGAAAALLRPGAGALAAGRRTGGRWRAIDHTELLTAGRPRPRASTPTRRTRSRSSSRRSAELDEGAEPHRVAGILAELASARWAIGRAGRRPRRHRPRAGAAAGVRPEPGAGADPRSRKRASCCSRAASPKAATPPTRRCARPRRPGSRGPRRWS